MACAPFYTSGPFVYNRMQPPLFIAVGESNLSVAEFLSENSREFYRLGCRNDVTHKTVMNCGATLGEYSILKSMDMNMKRIKKSKPTVATAHE